MTTYRLQRLKSFPGNIHGLSLIELMVAMVISLLLLAGLVTLVINANGNQAHLTQIGALDENGRYAIQQMNSDIRLAGFYGNLANVSVPAAFTNPCLTDINSQQQGMSMPVQGYTTTTTSADPLTCVPANGWKAGTDILVVRRASTKSCTPNTDCPAWVAGQYYMQSNGTNFLLADGATPAHLTDYTIPKVFSANLPDVSVIAPVRIYQEHIYYISPCLVTADAAGNCPTTNSDNIPTLKRIDLGPSAGGAAVLGPPVSLVEGVQEMHIDYGIDNNGDGTPDAYVDNTSSMVLSDWGNVVSLRVALLVRSSKTISGYNDQRTYTLTDVGNNPPQFGPYNDGYARHVFTRVMQLTNVSQRRE